MKSLRELRSGLGITLTDVENQTGINPAIFINVELGNTVPAADTRRRIQYLFEERINWLDTPRVNTRKPERDTTWIEAEKSFRNLVRLINGLPDSEKNHFLLSSLKYLRKVR